MKMSGRQIWAHLGKLFIIRKASNRVDYWTNVTIHPVGEHPERNQASGDFCGQPTHLSFLPCSNTL